MPSCPLSIYLTFFSFFLFLSIEIRVGEGEEGKTLVVPAPGLRAVMEAPPSCGLVKSPQQAFNKLLVILTDLGLTLFCLKGGVTQWEVIFFLITGLCNQNIK